MSDSGMTPDPWATLRHPTEIKPISGVRVDGNHPWDFYWALSSSGHSLLVLSHGANATSSVRLPRVGGLEVSVGRAAGSQNVLLIMTLTDASLRDIFWRLCTDIVDSTRACRTEQEAVSVAIWRTWRWHHLLRGGGDSRLSREGQIGLLGELSVLERLVLPNVSAGIAIEGWLGPERAPKDFELGSLGIEAKAYGPSKRKEVSISSIDQLSRRGLSALFLCVTIVASSPDEETGLTLTEVVGLLTRRIGESEPLAVGVFEAKLGAAGFDPTHDYSDMRWIVGNTAVYEVTEEFPRIEPSEVSASITKMQYAVRLSDCELFLVDAGRVESALREDHR